MGLLDLTAVELGKKIKAGEVSVLEATKAALDQIKEKDYCDSIKGYTGNILLVGINYDKDSKKHTCLIEEYSK